MDVAATLDALDADLKAAATSERADKERKYLKSSLVHWGVAVPDVRRAVAKIVKQDPGRPEVLAMVRQLWGDVHERRIAAIVLLARRVTVLSPSDLDVLIGLTRDSQTWAYVDALATDVIGVLIVAHPELRPNLDQWIKDENFWVRRTALLSLIPGIRKNEPELDRLSRYGDLVVEEREFFIRKALGWVLRELAKSRPEWVSAWLSRHAGLVSGVTLREAIKYLPEGDRKRLMA